MTKAITRLAIGVFLALSTCAWAASVADVPDCYSPPELKAVRGVPDGDVVVLLDDTTVFDQKTQQEISKHLTGLIRPGYSFNVFRFSAYADGRYFSPAYSFYMGRPITAAELEDIRKPVAKQFKYCMEIQALRADRLVRQSLTDYFNSASAQLLKSEIIAAMRDVSRTVLPNLHGKRKIVFVVSDMLENSGVTSFYANNGVRRVDHGAEIGKVEKSGLIGNFQGAEIYVLGAGTLPIDAKRSRVEGWREQATMDELYLFWAEYFRKSNGKLQEFGKPLLLSPIK